EIRGAVERNTNRAALARERRQDRLADPPHRVGDELHSLVRIELSRSSQQADVPLTDEIDERQSAVLIFLGHGDHEAQVALHELLQRVLIPGADLLRELDLLRTLEQRVRGDLVEVLVQDVALRLVGGNPRGSRAAASWLLYFGHDGLEQVLRVKVSIYEQRRPRRDDGAAECRVEQWRRNATKPMSRSERTQCTSDSERRPP